MEIWEAYGKPRQEIQEVMNSYNPLPDYRSSNFEERMRDSKYGQASARNGIPTNEAH